MSRIAPPRPGGAAGGGDLSDEICPVCKSSRYLNASLRFLVNPACYHKMCESCVDRIFSHGPQPCPIPKCKQTLRKHRFRTQTFEDIAVEREVDIRKNVAAVFNRREEEFESLRDYNDYLNEVEDITFNLINEIDVQKTNERFDAYKKAHEQEIAENASLAQRESMSYSKLQKVEREQAKQRREAARREEAEERRDANANRQDMLRRLEAGQDAEDVAAAGSGAGLKKRMNRQAAEQRQQQLQAASETRNGNGSSNLVIKGLKAKVKAEPEAPIDPFGGLSFEGRQYYTLQDNYVWDVLQDARKDPLIGAGGYDVGAFTRRALGEAFAGLGCFIADEATVREQGTQGAEAAGTARAELAAQDVKMQDVF
ncbi:unnamed protein product [Zymoseptoria tritici ST99CH_1E4]|uniref:RNA polymerase II transcription factor B subunit 3 n=1 Tax=Zymoseptoria tritici ST99CH_1E4 TaxID=1276532 RepID=A0A2H1GC57_ZYMTR|nr:unnamed protein product [Zymoseptoria tritici ST99CH_1E4]